MNAKIIQPKPRFNIDLDGLDIELSGCFSNVIGEAFNGFGNNLEEILENGVIFTTGRKGACGPQVEFDSLGVLTQAWLKGMIMNRMEAYADKNCDCSMGSDGVTPETCDLHLGLGERALMKSKI